MKLIRNARLYFREGQSDKVYEVDLCRLSQGRYVVNFRYGRRGGHLREGTKTVSPVGRQEADKIYDSVVVAKKNKGYADSDRDPLPKEESLPQATVGASSSTSDDRRDQIESAILARFQAALRSGESKKLRRAVWRIGELAIKGAVPDLMGLISSKDDLLNYCLAWSLGRCGDARAHDVLKHMVAGTGAEAVKRIALEAILATASAADGRDLMDGIRQQLPQPVRAALAAEDSNQLTEAAASAVFEGGPQGMDLLTALYQISPATPCARHFMLSALSKIPFEPGHFKAIRHIYKIAEFRCDAEVIGLLALRFETEKACFHLAGGGRYAMLPGTWKYVKVKAEVAKSNSRLAYSNRTRDYFRRRVWRMLRRMGNCADEGYVAMAVGVLLPFTDAHAATSRKATRYNWERGTDGRWRSVPAAIREYGPYAGYIAFNHILHAHHPNYRLSPNGLSWLTITPPSPEETGHSSSTARADAPPRYEAFPELWDRRPEALWQLLTESRCEPVHHFAARALRDNPDFCQQLSTEQIQELLSRPYAVTILLGLSFAEGRYDPANPDLDLIQALLAANLDTARQVGRQWIEDRPEILVQAAGLMSAILTCDHADVRQWGHTLIEQTAFEDAYVETVIARLVAFLLGLDDQADHQAPVVEEIGAVMLGTWANSCCRMDLQIMVDLLQHPSAAVQILAGRLLLQHHTPPAQLPPGLIPSLIDAGSPALRGIGVQLFSGLPTQMLLRHPELIYTFCTAEDGEVRRAALPLVKRLAENDAAFGRDLFERLFPSIFRKAPSPEFRRDLVALLSDSLARQALDLDPGTIWRLLKARARGAGQLGAHLLVRVEPQVFSIRQWAFLGSHALLSVRQWCWQVFREHPADIASNMSDGLRLLDSDWEDTRDFAIDYFRTGFDASHWAPSHLVSICDSIREDVQRFGRELITTFFEDQHGVEYLLKLSQHPSTNVQLFASNFLEDYAHDNLERIEALTPYFLTVLSRVNCGRVAKARIFRFLHNEALASVEAAALVAPICNRLSATIAIGDRGRCVQILLDISRRYPQVSTRLARIPASRRSINTVEVEHAI
jgi:hypothetical protein